jgi:hypothetical protein
MVHFLGIRMLVCSQIHVYVYILVHISPSRRIRPIVMILLMCLKMHKNALYFAVQRMFNEAGADGHRSCWRLRMAFKFIMRCKVILLRYRVLFMCAV